MADLRGFGVTSIHEGVELAGDEQESQARIKPYRIETLEDAGMRVVVAPELSGRIIAMTDKRKSFELLRRPSPGERGYPDVGGLAVSVAPDWHTRTRYPVSWTLESVSGTRELVLAGLAPNGLKLRHRIWRGGDEIRVFTETTLENTSAAAIDAALLWRVEADPGGDYRDVEVRFQTRDGSMVERTLVRLEEQPSGSESYIGGRLPQGEWFVANRQSGATFRGAVFEAARVNLSWTAKAQKRVTMEGWSAPQKLAPGERLQLRGYYGVYWRQ